MVRRRSILGAVVTTAFGGCTSLGTSGDGESTAHNDNESTSSTDDAESTTPGHSEPSTDGSIESATNSTGSFHFETPAFEDGAKIPPRYTADGANVSPPLVVGNVPSAASSLVVIVDDPGAPGGTFAHWLLWNLSPDVREIPEGVPAEPTLADLNEARQGTNGFGSIGYRGPRPPKGDGPHTYRFTLYALDTTLELEPGAKRSELETAMDGREIGTSRFTGEYER